MGYKDCERFSCWKWPSVKTLVVILLKVCKGIHVKLTCLSLENKSYKEEANVCWRQVEQKCACWITVRGRLVIICGVVFLSAPLWTLHLCFFEWRGQDHPATQIYQTLRRGSQTKIIVSLCLLTGSKRFLGLLMFRQHFTASSISPFVNL